MMPHCTVGYVIIKLILLRYTTTTEIKNPRTLEYQVEIKNDDDADD